MQKYIFRGGSFVKGLSVARAVLAHFTRFGVFQASPDGKQVGAIPIEQPELVSAVKTLTPEENGKSILYAILASGSITLPPARAGRGMRFSVSLAALPTGGVGAQLAAVGVDRFIGCGLNGIAGQVLRNPAASDVLGDSVTVVSDGVDIWYITDKTGIWALA
jgi:hypothetical protein